MGARIPAEYLGRFGICPDDEKIHPRDPAEEWWHESHFWRCG